MLRLSLLITAAALVATHDQMLENKTQTQAHTCPPEEEEAHLERQSFLIHAAVLVFLTSLAVYVLFLKTRPLHPRACQQARRREWTGKRGSGWRDAGRAREDQQRSLGE